MRRELLVGSFSETSIVDEARGPDRGCLTCRPSVGCASRDDSNSWFIKQTREMMHFLMNGTQVFVFHEQFGILKEKFKMSAEISGMLLNSVDISAKFD